MVKSYIDNCLKKLIKNLVFLKKNNLKFSVFTDISAKLYVFFFYKITARLCCGSLVWVYSFDVDKVERVKPYVARIVTGLSVISSTHSIYLGTG